MVHIHRKGNQSRRNVDLSVLLIVEGTGHAVLAADGRKSKAKLCVVSTKQGCKRSAPAGRILSHALEVLLEGEADLSEITAACHDLRYGRKHGINRTVIRAPAGQIRIIAVAHHGNGIGFSLQYRKLRNHSLGLGQLVLAAKRHKYAACADGAVKTLYQALLGAYI